MIMQIVSSHRNAVHQYASCGRVFIASTVNLTPLTCRQGLASASTATSSSEHWNQHRGSPMLKHPFRQASCQICSPQLALNRVSDALLPLTTLRKV